MMAVLLAVVTAFTGLFWLGDVEQHKLLLETAFWTTFCERFFGIALAGLIGSGIWLLFNMGLRRVGFIKNSAIGQTALMLLAAPIIGALLGTVFFCFA